MFQKLVGCLCIILLMQGCSIYLSHPHGKHGGKGGVVIKVPPKTEPEVKPMPES